MTDLVCRGSLALGTGCNKCEACREEAARTGICKPMEAGDEGWSKWIHPLPGYLMKCCDCGLVHEMEFEIVPHGEGRTELNPGESRRKGVIVFRARRHEIRNPADRPLRGSLSKGKPKCLNRKRSNIA